MSWLILSNKIRLPFAFIKPLCGLDFSNWYSYITLSELLLNKITPSYDLKVSNKSPFLDPEIFLVSSSFNSYIKFKCKKSSHLRFDSLFLTVSFFNIVYK